MKDNKWGNKFNPEQYQKYINDYINKNNICWLKPRYVA